MLVHWVMLIAWTAARADTGDTASPGFLGEQGEPAVLESGPREDSAVVINLVPPDPSPDLDLGEEAQCLEPSGQDWVESSEQLLNQQTFTLSSASGGGFVRGTCVQELGDFTLPALSPRNRSGQIPETLALNLFADTNLTATLREWRWNDDGSVSWIGILMGPAVAARGEVIITVVRGKYAMTARLGTLMWDLRTDDECGHRLEEWDEQVPSSVPECGTLPEGQVSTAYVQGQQVGYGVLPDHPEEVLPTIDFLIVGAQETLDAFANGDDGMDGFTAFAHNRIHEIDLSFLRTNPLRTHRPRLVGITVEPSILATDLSTDVVSKLKASATLDALRNDVGADVVAGLVPVDDNLGVHVGTGPQVNWRPGLEANPNGSASWANDGYYMSSSGPDATAKWSFSHEFGHVLGIQHANEPFELRFDSGTQTWVADTSYNGPAAIKSDVQYQGQGATFPYRDMMASSSAPGERTPVFGSLPTRAWVPRVTDDAALDYDPTLPGIQRDPKYDRVDLDLFMDGRFDPAPPPASWASLTQSFVTQGIRLGVEETLTGVPPFPDGDYVRCSGDLLFDLADTDHWSESDTPGVATSGNRCQIETGEHSLAENVAFYKEAATVPYELDLARILSLTENGGQLTLTFTQTDYAASYLPPSTCLYPWQTECVCTDVNETTCSLDANPYFIELGTSFGDDSIVSTWVTASACSTGTCTVIAPINVTVPPANPPDEVTSGTDGPYATLNPATMYYGRLWTQVRANDWGYVEFRLHHELPRLLACSAEDPELVPPGYANMDCPAGVVTLLQSSSAFPGTPAVQVSLDPTGAGTQPGDVHFTNNIPIFNRRIYGGSVYGHTEAGVNFCCHMDVPVGQTRGIDILGGPEDDDIEIGDEGLVDLVQYRLAHLAAFGGWGEDFINLATNEGGKVKAVGGLFDDHIHTFGSMYGTINGDGNSDTIEITWLGPWRPPLPPQSSAEKLVVNGGGGVDYLSQVDATWEPTDSVPPVELWGGGGGNTLCAQHGGTLLKGSSAGAGANTLYVSSEFSAATTYAMNPATSAMSAGSTCGAPNHAVLGQWAGSQCQYPAVMSRPTRCFYVLP